MLFAREDIAPNLIETEATTTECFYKELNLCNEKWLLFLEFPQKLETTSKRQALSWIQTPENTKTYWF